MSIRDVGCQATVMFCWGRSRHELEVHIAPRSCQANVRGARAEWMSAHHLGYEVQNEFECFGGGLNEEADDIVEDETGDFLPSARVPLSTCTS